MYRPIIEHAQWAPKEFHEVLAKRQGRDRGRIYRVYPKGARLRELPRLEQMSDKELLWAMAGGNGVLRDIAQMRNNFV